MRGIVSLKIAVRSEHICGHFFYRRTVHQSRNPTECNPDHRATDNAREIRALLDTVSVCDFIEKDASYDLSHRLSL